MASKEEERTPDQLDKIRIDPSAPTESDRQSEESVKLFEDELTTFSQAQLKAFGQKYADKIEAENVRFAANTKLRGDYAWALYWMCVGWLGLLACVVIAEGVLHAYKLDFVSDTVIVALTGGFAASIVGLVTIVATSLFPRIAERSVLESLRISEPGRETSEKK